jgi:Helicase associated domain
LGKWVAKQREQYRALKKGEHSFLTPDRLEQLNQIGFVWSMKGRVPREDDDDVDEAAAVAAAKAAVAAAVEAQNRHHQGEDEDDEDDDDEDENDHRVQVPAIKEDADEDVGVNMGNIPGDVSLNQSHPDIGLEAKVEYDDADPLSAMV